MYFQLDRWHLWWEWKRFYWMPHFVLYFGIRPKLYKVVIRRSDIDVKSIKCDPYSDLSGILIQKRDVFWFCIFHYFQGSSIFLKHD